MRWREPLPSMARQPASKLGCSITRFHHATLAVRLYHVTRMEWKGCLIEAGFLVLGLFVSFLIFRKKTRKERISRLPLFLTCAVPLFYLGFANWPVALEPIFTRIIGHSIWDTYHFPQSADGTHFSETWWVARWLEPLQKTVFALVVIGMVWAFFNVVVGRERKANAVGVLISIALFLLAAFLYASFGQFF